MSEYKIIIDGTGYTTEQVCELYCSDHQLALCMDIGKVKKNYDLCEASEIFHNKNKYVENLKSFS